MLSVRQYNVAFDRGELVLHLGHEIHKGQVQQNVFIPCMVDNVVQLLLK